MLLLSVTLAMLVSSLAYRARALTRGGAAAAWVVGTLIFGLGGWRWAFALLTFFCTSTLLSRWRRRQKAGLGFEKTGRRDARQVLANGGVAALSTIFPWLHLTTTPHAFVFFLGALAAANADTWATEIGAGFSGQPYDIWTRKAVPTGTSGAVSGGGLLAALAGAALLGLFSSTVATGLCVTASGLLGSLGDSWLGATVQAQWRDPRRPGHWTERPQPGPPGRGRRWMDNDRVNLLCTLLGALLAGMLINLPADGLHFSR